MHSAIVLQIVHNYRTMSKKKTRVGFTVITPRMIASFITYNPISVAVNRILNFLSISILPPYLII